ncbi:MAG TPA: zinc ribbon domain-containing protein [Candidatus Acidoferrales bacterium]|nr:zinc ribbon domain-containing protein [Candidatus Acidoferrales bacterium]
MNEPVNRADHLAKTIVNVGDQQWHLARTYGTYVIPPCAKGERCATLRIEGRVDRADIGDKRYSEFYFSAKQIAEDLVSDLTDHGVFVAAGDQPTDEEISAAQQRLTDFYKKLVFEADMEWGRHHNFTLLSDLHRRAAFALGIEKEWAYVPAALADCPACGEKVKPGVALCSHCGSILDREKARGFGLLREPEAGPGSELPRSSAGGAKHRGPAGRD